MIDPRRFLPAVSGAAVGLAVLTLAGFDSDDSSGLTESAEAPVESVPATIVSEESADPAFTAPPVSAAPIPASSAPPTPTTTEAVVVVDSAPATSAPLVSQPDQPAETLVPATPSVPSTSVASGLAVADLISGQGWDPECFRAVDPRLPVSAGSTGSEEVPERVLLVAVLEDLGFGWNGQDAVPAFGVDPVEASFLFMDCDELIDVSGVVDWTCVALLDGEAVIAAISRIDERGNPETVRSMCEKAGAVADGDEPDPLDDQDEGFDDLFGSDRGRGVEISPDEPSDNDPSTTLVVPS